VALVASEFSSEPTLAFLSSMLVLLRRPSSFCPFADQYFFAKQRACSIGSRLAADHDLGISSSSSKGESHELCTAVDFVCIRICFVVIILFVLSIVLQELVLRLSCSICFYPNSKITSGDRHRAFLVHKGLQVFNVSLVKIYKLANRPIVMY
jgi:hypothetical protein